MLKSIATKALIFICFAILITFVTVEIWRDAENIAVKNFISNRMVLIHETMRGIQTQISSIKGDARYLANLPEVQKLDIIAARQRMRTIYEARCDIVETLSRMDSAGTIVITVPYTKYEGASISDQAPVKKILTTRKSVIGGPLHTVQGFDAVIVHIPTFVKDSVFTGSIAALVAFDSLKSRFINPLGSEGEIVWLANSSGIMLVHPQYSAGKRMEEIYSTITDTSVINFMENFPPTKQGALLYVGSDDTKRIVCWFTAYIGFERWVLAIDSPMTIALSALASLKWKLIIVNSFILLVLLIGVVVMVRLSSRKNRIEQQNKYLKLVDAQREKLDFIYRFSQGLISLDVGSDVFASAVDALKTVAGVPFVIAWKYDSAQDKLVQGKFIIEDFRLAEELRLSGIDIAQMDLKEKFHEIDLRKLSGHIALPIKEFAEINPSWAVLTHSLRALFQYTNIIVIPLSLRDNFFGCLMAPGKADVGSQAEIMESFRLAVSQVLYMRSILGELISNNRINQDILNTVDKAIFLVDSNFILLSASPVFYRIYDVKGKAVGNNLFEVVPFLKNLHAEEVYREVIKTRSSVETEETYLSEGKRPRYTLTKVIPITSEGETVKRILTIVDDVSEFRLLEEQLKHTAEELGQKNRQLQRLAITDELTQLRNYRCFTEKLPEYISRHRSEGNALSLIAMDLDGFKNYNDTYGHPAGDRVLMEIADVMRGFLRSGDLGARYGGDEFVLVLSDTDLIEAQDVAERICARLRKAAFPDLHGTRKVHISASLGIAVLQEDVVDAEELHRRADAALYVSKRKGKNRVSIYGGDETKKADKEKH